jgi:hypothetical protein
MFLFSWAAWIFIYCFSLITLKQTMSTAATINQKKSQVFLFKILIGAIVLFGAPIASMTYENIQSAQEQANKVVAPLNPEAEDRVRRLRIYREMPWDERDALTRQNNARCVIKPSMENCDVHNLIP